MKNIFALAWWNGSEDVVETFTTDAPEKVFDGAVHKVQGDGEGDYSVEDVEVELKQQGFYMKPFYPMTWNF